MAFKKSIEAKVVSGATLNKLRELSPVVHVDQHQLQRLLSEWDDKTKAEHVRACFVGHSNIYTIVLISIKSCLDYCNNILSDYDTNTSEYLSVKETIDYLSNLDNDGKRYLLIDGQHRWKTYNDYLKSKFSLDVTVVDYINNGKSVIPFDMKGVLFKDLPKETQQTVLDTPLTMVVIEKGTLQDMVDVTVYTNIGEPWNNHERRVIIPSSFNRLLMKFINENPLLTSMFERTKNLSGAYSLTKKGESLMVCEWIGYHYNVLGGDIYKWPKDSQLDTQSSIQSLKGQSKSMLKKSTKLVQLVADLTNATKSVKYERTFLDNLFILLTILDNPSHPLNTLGKQVKVRSLSKFIDWFLKMESTLRERDFYHRDSDGNIILQPITGTKLTNSESFKRKCGNKKIDDIQLRSTQMITEFNNDYDTLFADGVISLIDTKNYTKKDKLQAAISADWVDADGDEFTFEQLMGVNSIIEGDHQESRDAGNSSTSDNLVLRTKRSNIRKSNKKMAS